MLNALQINPKNYTLSTFPSSNRRHFEDSGISAGRFCVSILPEYCSSALTAQAYKMVITTACVQIDNCFCNTLIVVHLFVTKVILWHDFLAIYRVFSLTWTQSGIP